MGQFSYNPLNGNLDFSSNGLEAGTLEFMGNISVASDFPTSAQVQENDIYRVLAGVTDNDVTKTNTGQTFVAGDEIMWDGAGWDLLGNYVSLLGTNNTWTGVNVFNEITGNKVRAVGSGGLLIESNNGTDVVLFGAGGGAGVTFYGSLTTNSITASSSVTTTNILDLTGSSLTTGGIIYGYSNSADTSTRSLASFINDHASAVGTTVFYGQQDSTGGLMRLAHTGVLATNKDAFLLNCTGANTNGNTSAMYVLQNNVSSTAPAIRVLHTGNGRGLSMVTSNTTDNSLYIIASSLTTGRGASIYSNSSSTSQFVLLDLTNANAAATGMIPLAIANASPTSTNYFRMMYLGGNSGGNFLWKANGVTPNGNLPGGQGDICIGADGGKAYYCGGGTTWTAM